VDQLASLFSQPRETEVVKTPRGEFTVRGLTADEWDDYERSCTVEIGGKATFKNNRAKLVQLGTIKPESGLPLFSPEDVEKLGRAPAKVIRPLFDAIAKLSGVGGDVGNG
jgi:hypothetical protein